jgi:hypothetical protein
MAIDKLTAHLEIVSKLLDEKIGVDGKHQLRAIDFAIDPDTLPRRLANLNPIAFRIERRRDVEYSLNRFFSFANATTSNHLVILEKLERLASSQATVIASTIADPGHVMPLPAGRTRRSPSS